MGKNDLLKKQAEQQAIDAIRKQSAGMTTEDLISGILKSDRGALSRAITLVESTNAKDKLQAREIIKTCLPKSGNSIRIGITGIPGAGKSTFIEALGMYLTELGKKVAVLAIDPSSPVSGGSIMGDKTRMNQLSMSPNAFVRPSASAKNLGGVARKTRESIILCEAAGFDVILVETVGVGQSETAVYDMTDTFLLLLIAGAGDQLQGIKRGIMEMCDVLIINKADGENTIKAQRAKAEFSAALHFFAEKESGWYPKVETCSALEKTHIDKVWDDINEHEKWTKDRGWFAENRIKQDIKWMRESIHDHIAELIDENRELNASIKEAESLITSKQLSSFQAAEKIFEKFKDILSRTV